MAYELWTFKKISGLGFRLWWSEWQGPVSDGWRFNPLQQWWAKEGFIQVQMDHRGSGHFGKKEQIICIITWDTGK
jgi:hypothetical protein